MESVLDFQERVDALKNELIEQVEKELKSPLMAEFDVIDLGCVINSHYPDDGCALYYNIECVYLNGATLGCRGYFGEDTSDYSRFDEKAAVFDCETILRILKQVRKIAREIKLAKLRKLVASGGGKIEFNGSFKFTGDCEGRSDECQEPCEDCQLNKLELVNGKLVVFDRWQGIDYDNTDAYLPDYELDRIIDYVKTRTIDISLTEEQRHAIENLKAAFQKLADLDVVCVYETDYGLLEFFNKKDIEEYEFFYCGRGDKCDGFVDVQDQLDNECESIENIGYYNAFNNEKLFVKPKS